MPVTSAKPTIARRSAYRIRGKSAKSVETESRECGEFLHIGPAIGSNGGIIKRGLGPRAHSTLGGSSLSRTAARIDSPSIPKDNTVMVDRISLDRRGLSAIPSLIGDTNLRLLSLQHNLLCSLNGLTSSSLVNLVFLDVYDNQIDKICCLDGLKNLRVLLMGKNRIRKIENLSKNLKLEVLDLHGNRISQADGLYGLNELKVLNLAGNQLKNVELSGLPELRELNLKRNRLRKLSGCDGAPKIQKLFLSNNDLQSIDDISTVATALSLREITLDNNPVSLGGDCVSFLVSYLPNLHFLSQMQVTEQVRRSAMAWRQNKEVNNAIFNTLGKEMDSTARREQVISNARTNWELLRSQNKSLMPNTNIPLSNNSQSEFTMEANGIPKSETPDLIKTTTLTNNTQMINQHKKFKQINASSENMKRVNFSYRSVSQDTDISHSTSTSSEVFKLPPILVPIIDSLEHPKLNLNTESAEKRDAKCLKRWESISSMDPLINSSLSSLPTTTSESESEVPKKVAVKRVPTANRKRAAFAASKSVSIAETGVSSKAVNRNQSMSDNSENLSLVSATTNLQSSTSGSDCRKREGLVRASSAKGRNIKSATTARKPLSRQSSMRAVTAKPKSVKPAIVESQPHTANQPEPAVKDREQGGDWLIEVRGGQASIWGAGALKRLEKSWPIASDVTAVYFHYVSYISVCTMLPTIKQRFPNAVHFTFRACGISCAGQIAALASLRGISSLNINREGNPITLRSWQSYALFRLAHWGLKSLDQCDMSEEQIKKAHEEYFGLSEVVLRSLPDSLLQPLLCRLQGERESSKILNSITERIEKERNYSRFNVAVRKFNIEQIQEAAKENDARSWLWNSDAALRDVVAREALQWRRSAMTQEEVVLRHRGRTHLSRVLCMAAEAAIKLRLLRRLWPSILLQLITSILVDYCQMDTHVIQHLKQLEAELYRTDTTHKR